MRVIDQKYKASVLGIRGDIWLQGDERGLTARYLRGSRLGGRLASDAGSSCAILSNYIRQELGLPRGDGFATVITYLAAD